MAIKYLLDENVAHEYRTQLKRRVPDLVVWVIGDPGAPPRGTLDPEILIWCEAHGFMLVTGNRTSMPVHLTNHLAAGRHAPGILIIGQSMTMGETIEELTLVAIASLPDEYSDLIVNLPLLRAT